MNSVLVVVFSIVFATLVSAENPDIIWKIIYPNRAAHPSILIAPDALEDQDLQDVYWRTWKNRIPLDAIVAGHTQTEYGIVAPLFLAEVFVSNGNAGLQPGQLFLHSKSVKTSFGGRVYRSDKQIKVLCAKDQDIVTWIPVNKTTNLTAEKDCVISGYEGNTRHLFFGRTIYDGDLIVGKASIKDKTLHFPYAGNEKLIKENFEVLCYKEAMLKINQKIEEVKEKNDAVTVEAQTTRSIADRRYLRF